MPNDDAVGKGGWGGENVSKSDDVILVRIAHAAVKSEDDKIVALLRDVPSIDWNAGDSDGMTPLHWALLKGYKKIVKRILDIPGINYQVKTNFGSTLADAAVSSGDDEIMALLSSKL